MRLPLTSLGLFGALLILAGSVSGHEWHGLFQQGYQERRQLFHPTHVRPWLSDAVGRATAYADLETPVTTVQVNWDFSFLSGALTLGVYARTLYWASLAYPLLVLPWLHYHDDHHTLQAGRFSPDPWGAGLLLGSLPAAGVRYIFQNQGSQTRFFYHALFERSAFQTETVRFTGVAQTLDLPTAQIGLLVVHDDSEAFRDASRARVRPGWGASLAARSALDAQAFWQAECAYAAAWSASAQLQSRLFSWLAWKTEAIYLGTGFNPLWGQVGRESLESGQLSLALPLDFFSGRLRIEPAWGVKRTAFADYWLPGLAVEAIPWEGLRLNAAFRSEQPQNAWGDYGHYEYTEASASWRIVPGLDLTLGWSKTFNGFLAWKDSQTRAELEFDW